MSDVTVHIDENLDASALLALQNDLSHLQGVEHIDTADQRPHLMVVKYDHREMDSTRILSRFRDHGYHAELIGF